MPKAREEIVLRYHSQTDTYKVVKLVNRMNPNIGTILDAAQVSDLLIEANRLSSTLNIKIN